MAQNRFYKTTPTQFVLPETPLEPLLGALQTRQKRYDEGFALADELSNKYIDALPQDRARANELQQGWQQKIDKMVESTQGDYSQMYKDLYGLKRDITKTLSPGGEGAAIQLNKKTYTDRLAEERKRLAKGEITQGMLQNWQDYTLSGYTGAGQVDPTTGNYNLLNPEDIAMYVDPDKILHETLKNLAAEKGGKEIVNIGGSWVTKVGDKWEEIDPKRVQEVSMSTLIGNPQYVNMMSQQARWKGLDPVEVMSNDVMSRASNMEKIYSYQNVWRTKDVKANEFALIRARASAQKQMLQELLQPGPTMPGLTQNTNMDRYKVTASNIVGVTVGRRGYAGYKNVLGMDPGEFQNRQRQKLADAPQMQRAFDLTAAQIKATPGYANLSNEEKNQLLNKTWNSKIDSMPTFNQTAVNLETDFLKHYEKPWKEGAYGMAMYYKINDNNSLGKQVKAPPDGAKDHMPTSVQVIDGKRGSVMAVDGKKYLVVNTPWHDKVEETMSGLEALYAPYTGGRAETSINMPLPDGSGYVRVDMTAELDPSTLKRVVTLKYPDKSVEIMTDDRVLEVSPDGKQQKIVNRQGALSAFQADITKAAAAEMHRGVARGSNFFESYDKKQLYDNPKIIGLSNTLFGNSYGEQ